MTLQAGDEKLSFEEAAQLFIKGVVELEHRFHVSLAHEDEQGSFLVMPYSGELQKWLEQYAIKEGPDKPSYYPSEQLDLPKGGSSHKTKTSLLDYEPNDPEIDDITSP